MWEYKFSKLPKKDTYSLFFIFNESAKIDSPSK